MLPTNEDLMKYISTFYKTVDTKLNFLTQSVTMLRDHMTRLYGLRNDALQIPPATGHLKLKQDGCLQLLILIDAILRDAGISYFLGYGNLLGAARTGGFIPWDDDMDICLMRPDFERATEILSQHFNRDNFITSWGLSGGLFKVIFANKICVDLFPWDFYYTRMETPEQFNTFNDDYITAMIYARNKETEIQQIATPGQSIITQVPTERPNYKQIRDELIMHGNTPDTINGDIFEGIDWQTGPERMSMFFHNKPFRHEWIFPLGEIEFCGRKFPAPNNVDAVLTTRFGDWGDFKPDFARHSNSSFTYDELTLVRKFIAGEIK